MYLSTDMPNAIIKLKEYAKINYNETKMNENSF